MIWRVRGEGRYRQAMTYQNESLMHFQEQKIQRAALFFMQNQKWKFIRRRQVKNALFS